ncbi:MAG: acetoacetate--CoA ligase [Pseudomonadota bacterium]
MQNRLLWSPSQEQIEESRLTDFARYATQRTGLVFDNYDSLHEWSCETGGMFWDVLWDYAELVGEKGGTIVAGEDKMPGAAYFPDAKLNYAENLLKYSGSQEAIVFRCEDKVETRLTRDALQDLASRFQQAFRNAGVKKGDRVAAMLPNMPETIAAMLGAVSIGAIWSSCSPDFGVKGVLDRFGQISPKIFLSCDGYWYGGKRISIEDKLSQIVPELGAETTVIIPLLGEADQISQDLPSAVSMTAFVERFDATSMQFERVEFSHPLYILFSSGTTGVPKCIVHSHGGALLQLVKEHQLHVGMKEGDKVFFFTTCGWMMWNWLVTALSSGVTLMLYDGSPFHPGPTAMFDYAQDEKFTLFGTSAKFIDAVRNAGLKPIETHDLSSVRMLCSTGSPLAPENFEFVYSDIKADVHLASMSGGTDIMGCFVIGVSWLPVYKGEIQAAALGMDVHVWDDEGGAMSDGKGELVCSHAFPSMPVMFWNDEDGSKYHGAYFGRYENVWCHGDFAEWTETGGMIIHGRSDATLNPGGVRIGTAEIYNQVEQMPEVEEGLCIGQQWNNDVRVVLFVRLAGGVSLSNDLITAIKKKIREGASPRHVPAKVIEVADIPRTKSGKITELAVRDMVHGKDVKNREALANPEALDHYIDIKELSED